MPVRNILAARLGVGRNMEKKKVCRCLFGRPDPEELRRVLNEDLKKINTEMASTFRSTWNFDPELDKPLDGRYEWTIDASAPDYFKKGYKSTEITKRTSIESDAQSSGLDSEPETSTESSMSVAARLSQTQSKEDTEADVMELKRENEKTPESQTIRQTLIPEYMRKRKHRPDDDEQPRPAKALRF